ncbi:RNA polymerase sigma factor [Pontibacter rugosus]|uniref:RNA polymerase sigma factor n=1 Tax=Pontibacter rugosus TaxID=1745966 RepID=A0ABW3SU90_9BACT
MFLKLFSKARPPDDLELVKQYQQTGDLACIGKLFDRHTEMVYLICMKYMRDEEESKDATMQIFEGMVKSLRKYEVQNFKSWLHTTARNHCLMLLRAQKQREKILPRNVQENEYTIASSILEDENNPELELQTLEQGLQDLPTAQRTCIELFYLKQKSYKQIAEQTGLSLNNVKSYIQNGKRNLKLYLEKNNAK